MKSCTALISRLLVGAAACLFTGTLLASPTVTYNFTASSFNAIPGITAGTVYGSLTLAAPANPSTGWAEDLPFNLSSNLVDFSFNFGSIGGPTVTKADLNQYFSISTLTSGNGSAIDGGTVIMQTNTIQQFGPAQLQLGFNSQAGLDDVAYLPSAGGRTDIRGDWTAAAPTSSVPDAASTGALLFGSLLLLGAARRSSARRRA